MYHTKGCREVLQVCDFPENQYRLIEKLLLKHSPKQITQVVWAKDKDGEHDDFEWFMPLFDHYIPAIGESINIVLDDWFWEAYDYLAQFVEDDFHITDLRLISEMSESMDRLKQAISKSKPNIRYVYKVWKNIISHIDISKIHFEPIKRHEVRTSDFTFPD
jgi:hypothetical protein